MNVALAPAGSPQSPSLSDAVMREIHDSSVEDRLATAIAAIAKAAPDCTAIVHHVGTP